jgi:chromosomal replication initiator protein
MVLTSGAEFARDFAHSVDRSQALDRQQLSDWQVRIRSAGLLVLEDLGQLAGKPAAQQELIHALDELAARDALVIVTARSLAQQITTLHPALRSRLAGGLSVPLALPGSAARRTILEQLARARGLSLPKSLLQSLSGGPTVPVSALHGAIAQLELAAHGGLVDHDDLRRLAAEHPSAAAPPTLREIAGAAAKYFELKLSDLKSPSRRQAVVAARGVAIYLARLLTHSSLDEIGKYFGGRDHTTVLHGHRRTEKLMRRDPATRHAVSELKKTLVA